MDIIFLSENKAISLKILAIMEAQVKAMSERLVFPMSWKQVEVVDGETRLLQASFTLSNGLKVTLHFPHTTQLLEAVRKQAGLTQPSYCEVFRTITDDGNQPRLTVVNNQSQIHFGTEHMELPCTEEDERVLRKNTTEFLNHCIRDLLQLNLVPAAVPATGRSNPVTSAPVLKRAHSNVLSSEVVPYVPDVMPDPLSSNDGFDGQLRANFADAQEAERENAANITHVRGEIQQLIASMEALMRNQSRLETSEITRHESEKRMQKQQLERQLEGLQAEASRLKEKVIQCHKALQTVLRVRQQPESQGVPLAESSKDEAFSPNPLVRSESYFVPVLPRQPESAGAAIQPTTGLYPDLLSQRGSQPAASPPAVTAVTNSSKANTQQPTELHRKLCAYTQRQLFRLQEEAANDPIKIDPLRVREWAQCCLELDSVNSMLKVCQEHPENPAVQAFIKQQSALKDKLEAQIKQLNPCVWVKKDYHNHIARSEKMRVLGYVLNWLQDKPVPHDFTQLALREDIEHKASQEIEDGLYHQVLAILSHHRAEISASAKKQIDSDGQRLAKLYSGDTTKLNAQYNKGLAESWQAQEVFDTPENLAEKVAQSLLTRFSIAPGGKEFPLLERPCKAEGLLQDIIDPNHPIFKILGETRLIKVGETTTMAGFHKLYKCQGKFDRLGDDFSDVPEPTVVVQCASGVTNAKLRAQYLALNHVPFKQSEGFQLAVTQALGRFITNTLDRYTVEFKTAKGDKADALNKKITALKTAQGRLNSPSEGDSAVKLLADLLNNYHPEFSFLWQPRKSGGTPTIIKDLLAFRDKINKPEYADVKEGQVVFSGLGSAFEPAKVGKLGVFKPGEGMSGATSSGARVSPVAEKTSW